ncbi:hypothetical protein AQUCO_01000098v1 [Aquilegia coerulea]|uniref:Polysaccharide biosynthesis protein C-terminal domain-containing protein n=1 Tax=Aquilegia coerulea TaxID=218851 RepID=A0A2G5E8W2_AQUCA|nr:hypothetical protein AQUCO_01000098v1 [Aquilegia coerulea]
MASALETLCGQAYGAKKYSMMGVYLQRSWIILFICSVLLLPMYIFATPILKVLGQPDDVAEQTGLVAIWMIPVHFAFTFQFPLQRFLQSQLKNAVVAWVTLVALIVHIFNNWFFVYRLKLGLIGAVVISNISWWIIVLGMFGYTICGGCPLTWSGFSTEAFSGLWEFLKLSAASGVMLCLENWYYRILVLLTGNLKNAKIAVDALAVWYTLSPFSNFFSIDFSVIRRVAVGSGWQAYVAYINIGCYYIIGVPLGIVMGWVFHLGVMAEKARSRMKKLSSG